MTTSTSSLIRVGEDVMVILAFSGPVLVNLVSHVPTFVQPGVSMVALANQDIQFTGDILACGRTLPVN